jgi:predicted AlkP superfamily pyrophosphatase or phosphodiesterase
MNRLRSPLKGYFRQSAFVVQALMKEGWLESEEWGILIGHYLGVDHAGHTFSVDSPEMLRKIQQMDQEIVEVCLDSSVTECFAPWQIITVYVAS